SQFSSDGISAGYHGSIVAANTISDGPIGIAWRQADFVAGTSQFRRNNISATTTADIYVSPGASGGATRESFAITWNTLAKASGSYLDLGPTTVAYTVCCNERVSAGGGAPTAPTGTGTTYYVSPSGSDSNPGTSPASAWRTVSRVNRADLSPGDAVLFQGG